MRYIDTRYTFIYDVSEHARREVEKSFKKCAFMTLGKLVLLLHLVDFHLSLSRTYANLIARTIDSSTFSVSLILLIALPGVYGICLILVNHSFHCSCVSCCSSNQIKLFQAMDPSLACLKSHVIAAECTKFQELVVLPKLIFILLLDVAVLFYNNRKDATSVLCLRTFTIQLLYILREYS